MHATIVIEKRMQRMLSEQITTVVRDTGMTSDSNQFISPWRIC